MFFRWLAGLFFSLFLCGFSFAEFTVSGTVKDKTGKTLPGAAVICKGTQNGAETDIDGHFSFNSKKSRCSIHASFVGYEDYNGPTIEGTEGTKNVSITLKEGEQLDEVVIVTCGRKSYKKTEDAKSCTKCPSGQISNKTKTGCIDGPTITNAEDPTHVDHGLKCDLTRVMHGTCRMDFYNMLNIRQSDTETTPTEFVQDFVLTATTFIGTVLTFALVVSGLMIIFGGANENTASRGRQGIKYALIGYVIVLCSYTVIRLVQYLAAG